MGHEVFDTLSSQPARGAGDAHCGEDLAVWSEDGGGEAPPQVYRGDRKFVHIDIDPYQLGRVIPPDLGIVSDAKLALKAMRYAAGDMAPAREPGSWELIASATLVGATSPNCSWAEGPE